MTAKEARGLALIKKNDELTYILARIKIAATVGKTELRLNKSISSYVKEHLTELGYTIQDATHHEILIIIKW